MYQEIEMYKQYKKEKQIKHNHEKIASISALAFFAVLAMIITIVNQFTFVNTHKCGIVVNAKITIKQINYFYNVNTNKFG